MCRVLLSILQARFPFLDENVIKTLLEIPLWDIANLDEPVGKGDKKILREVGAYFELNLLHYIPFCISNQHILAE